MITYDKTLIRTDDANMMFNVQSAWWSELLTINQILIARVSFLKCSLSGKLQWLRRKRVSVSCSQMHSYRWTHWIDSMIGIWQENGLLTLVHYIPSISVCQINHISLEGWFHTKANRPERGKGGGRREGYLAASWNLDSDEIHNTQCNIIHHLA